MEDPEKTSSLRQRAEGAVRKKEVQSPDNLDAVSIEETRQALHELRVHQVELEMQNEEFRRAQVELDAERAHFFELFDLAPVGYLILSEKGLIQEANLTAATLLGVKRSALVHQPISRFILKGDQDLYYRYRKQLAEPIPPPACELRLLRKDGTQFWAQVTASLAVDAAGEPVCRLVLTDITANKQASEARFHTLADLAPVGIYLTTSDGRCQYANPRWCEMTGLSLEAALGDGWINGLHPEDRPSVRSAWHQMVTSEGHWGLEYRFLTPAGKVTWVWGLAAPQRDALGKVVGYVGINSDITTRKQAEAAIHQSEARFRAIATHTPDHILMQDRDLRYVFVINPQLGLSEADMIGKTERDFLAPEDAEKLMAIKRKVLEAGESVHLETPLLNLKGETEYFEGAYIPIFDTAGKADGLIGYFRNVTARKQAEEQLRESEARFHGTLDAMEEGVLLLGQDWRYLYINKSAEMQGRRPAKELLGKTVMECWPVYEATDYFRMQQKVMQEQLPAEIEGPFTFPEGEQRWFHWSVQPAAGGLLVVTSDITERKQAESELRFTNLLLATQQEASMDGILVVDETGRILSYNRRFIELWGLPAKLVEARVDEPVLAFVTAQMADPPAFLQRVRYLLDHRQETSQDELLLADGRTFDRYSAPMFGPGEHYYGRVWYFRDITVSRQNEQALRASEEQHRNLIHNLNVGIVVHAPDTRILIFNKTSLTLLGLSAEQMLGKAATDPAWHFVRETGGRMRLEDYPVMQVLTTRRPLVNFVAGVNQPDGNVRTWVLVNAFPDFDAHQQLHQVVVTFQDITERSRAEAALREMTARLHLATASAKAGVWDWNLQTNEMIWDDRMLLLYGRRRDDFPGGIEAWEQGLHPEDAARAKEECQAALRGEREFDTEFRVRHPNGTVLHIRANGLVLRDAAGNPIRMLGVNFDVTEHKRLEQQLLQAQKMEAIGQLAGGVAHDFNNIMAATMMQLSFLKRNTSLDPEAREILNELMDGAKRAASLTSQLLMFSRKSVMEIQSLDMNEVVANLLKMLSRLIGEQISLRFDRGENLPAVEADARMVEQVVVNLAVNARDAMPKGGLLTIRLESVHIDTPRTKAKSELHPGLFVCLSVADTGSGMDEATIKRIFEPFFTTKEVGKGTGLGLATVHGIVAQHKGWVDVESELGKGSTFKVFLPATTQGRTEPTTTEKRAVIRGRETILLVEDEAGLRRLVAQGLRMLGYQVLEADNGQTAMKLWQEHGQHIDLLFSDMMMPEGLTGLDLAEKLRQDKTNLQVIISSGYNVETAGLGKPSAGGIVYFQKPYEFEELSKTIRDCLDHK